MDYEPDNDGKLLVEIASRIVDTVNDISKEYDNKVTFVTFVGALEVAKMEIVMQNSNIVRL